MEFRVIFGEENFAWFVENPREVLFTSSLPAPLGEAGREFSLRHGGGAALVVKLGHFWEIFDERLVAFVDDLYYRSIGFTESEIEAVTLHEVGHLRTGVCEYKADVAAVRGGKGREMISALTKISSHQPKEVGDRIEVRLTVLRVSVWIHHTLLRR